MPAAPSSPLVVAADHPSLDRAVEAFLDQVRHGPRRMACRAGSSSAPPDPALADALAGYTRLAVIERGEVVALGRIDHDGVVVVAVAASHRGRDLDVRLTDDLVARARGHAAHPG